MRRLDPDRSRRDRKRRIAAIAVAPLPFVATIAAIATGATGASCASRHDAAAPTDDAGACAFTGDPDPPLPSPPRHTPRWAFEPWISKDISSTDDTYAFVDGCASRGIPVGVVVLDSPWETNYDTFVPHATRYHDFAKLVADMHARGVRVVPWIVPMVNTASFDVEPGADRYDGGAPTFDEGAACGFFVNDATTYFWWKGRGAALDFTSDRARAWWHRQEDAALAMGIDGWKLDFAENYVTTDPVQTSAGPIAHQAYSEAYYQDFLAYGARARGGDFVTMVRGWDASYHFAPRFYAKKEDAPVVWAGDNRRDWIGMADALETMFRSSNAGYVVVGSDVGGYLGFDDQNVSTTIPFDTEVFARWTALGALSPLMQLHGQANVTPWTVPDHADLIVDVYRQWARLHRAMVPFFYSLAEEAYAGGAAIVRPVGGEQAWAGDFRYLLGDALLVAPIVAAGGKRDVALPAGARWYDWWDAAAPPIDGGTTLAQVDATDWHRAPLYARQGAIVPLDVDADLMGLGTAASKGARTILWWPGAAPERFVVHDEDGATTTIDAQNVVGVGARVALSRRTQSIILRARADEAPSRATLDGAPLPARATRADFDASAAGWLVDAATKSAWVKVEAGGAATIVLEP